MDLAGDLGGGEDDDLAALVDHRLAELVPVVVLAGHGPVDHDEVVGGGVGRLGRDLA